MPPRGRLLNYLNNLRLSILQYFKVFAQNVINSVEMLLNMKTPSAIDHLAKVLELKTGESPGKRYD